MGSFVQIFQKIDEQKLSAVKQELLKLLPRLIEAKSYFEQNDIADASDCSLLTNEQAAKDQLVLPVLRALGYELEYRENHLEVWAEAKMGREKKAPKVDYAIYLKGETIPRVIIEAKAISSFEGTRGDYGTPAKQVANYYRTFPDAIYLPILSNGLAWSIYKREGTEGNRRALSLEPEVFTLEDLLQSEQRLNLFVHTCAKHVIETMARSKADVDDYDRYLQEIEIRQKLNHFLNTSIYNTFSAQSIQHIYGKHLERIEEDFLKPAGCGFKAPLSKEERGFYYHVILDHYIDREARSDPQPVEDDVTEDETESPEMEEEEIAAPKNESPLLVKRLTLAEIGELVPFTKPVRFGLFDRIFEVHAYNRMLYLVVTELEKRVPGRLKKLAIFCDSKAKADAKQIKVTQRESPLKHYYRMPGGLYMYHWLSGQEMMDRIQWFLEQYQIPLDAFWAEFSFPSNEVGNGDASTLEV